MQTNLCPESPHDYATILPFPMITAHYSSLLKILNNKDLAIPSYQRPYKWIQKDVSVLLDDLYSAYKEKNPYRLGNIILHEHYIKKGDSHEEIHRCDIVDGQQRLLTLSLFFHALDENYSNALLMTSYGDIASINNLRNNYSEIKKWAKDFRKEKVTIKSFSFLEVVVINVTEVEEAFTLFDSQNTRGLKLDPHDLLKAHHLREMDRGEDEKKKMVSEFENIPPQEVREIYGDYLYPIHLYLEKKHSHEFTTHNIEAFKGIGKDKAKYGYASIAKESGDVFLINEPFLSGSHFFKMTEHYLELLKKVKKEADSIPEIKSILEMKTRRWTGFGYMKRLFYQTLLYFHDRFEVDGKLDEPIAIKKLFAYCLMLFIDTKSLGEGSISKYALGEENARYSNHCPIFSLIQKAKAPKEISLLEINTQTSNDKCDEELLKKVKALLENEDE